MEITDARPDMVEEAARKYLGGGCVLGGGGARAASAPSSSSAEPADDEVCCICQDEQGDLEVCELLGEPLETACGHRFHASCYARLMETSEHDPVCPMCRTGSISARFVK